jgi:Ca2+-binding RTX toxin-like protein
MADILIGTPHADVICAGPGNDFIHGGRGNDVIVAGPGRDRVDAGPGNDEIAAADRSPDRVNGGRGHDQATVDPGRDHLRLVEQTRHPATASPAHAGAASVTVPDRLADSAHCSSYPGNVVLNTTVQWARPFPQASGMIYDATGSSGTTDPGMGQYVYFHMWAGRPDSTGTMRWYQGTWHRAWNGAQATWQRYQNGQYVSYQQQSILINGVNYVDSAYVGDRSYVQLPAHGTYSVWYEWYWGPAYNWNGNQVFTSYDKMDYKGQLYC